MTKAQIAEARLEEAIAMARRMGFRVAPGDWGIHSTRLRVGDSVATEFTWQPVDPQEPCLCPMACVIMGKTARNGLAEEAPVAAEALGLSVSDVSAFICGFDGLESEAVDLDGNALYALGKKLRVKVLAENGVLP